MNFKEVPMYFKIEYLGVSVYIDTGAKQITIYENNVNSEKMINMIFKAILNKINIDTNNYTVVRKNNS